jgi:hypothetical protein
MVKVPHSAGLWTRKSTVRSNRVCGPPIERQRRSLAFYGDVPTKSGCNRADSPNNGGSEGGVIEVAELGHWELEIL